MVEIHGKIKEKEDIKCQGAETGINRQPLFKLYIYKHNLQPSSPGIILAAAA